jgi:hypothetical protein
MLSTITSVGSIGAVANYSGEGNVVNALEGPVNIIVLRILNAHRLCLFPQAEQPTELPKVWAYSRVGAATFCCGDLVIFNQTTIHNDIVNLSAADRVFWFPRSVRHLTRSPAVV